MPKTELITVAMPVYNAELYLKDSIESILNQSYTNFEFIIIDDGSTDSSFSIVKSFAATDKRIKFFKQTNQKIAKTMSRIIKLSSGKYIARMDADDIAIKERLELQLSYLLKNNLDICGGWAYRFGNDAKLTKIKTYILEDQIKSEMLFNYPFVNPTLLFKKEVFDKISYGIDCWEAEDYDLLVKASIAGFRMANIPMYLLYYRYHLNQTSVLYFTNQLKHSNSIKKKYWNFYVSGLETIDESLLCNVFMHNKFSFLELNNFLEKYLGKFKGDIVFYRNIRKIYLLNSHRDLGSFFSWLKFSIKFRKYFDPTSFIILFLALFKIKPVSLFFNKFKFLFKIL